MSVVIETTLGDFTVDLYIKERPKCCFNFLKLCRIKYYNCVLFHRIERDFIAQSGDPTGQGTGGCSVYALLGKSSGEELFFPREVKPKLRHEKKGTLSMVNNGSDLHGSQFFITLADGLDSLDDGGHTVFGQVVEGLDVIDKINSELCDTEHRPYRENRITHTVIVDDPFEDPEVLRIPVKSPSPDESMFRSMDRIGIDEEIDETTGKSLAEIEEEIAAKEAKARATILEMVGDLPDADVAPPDNVLFVCKLNSVTRDEDLQVIFSRFGPITSCEVIRDVKTGESLQYAFIEFENAADCEKAYFKMDNVLIDDRRIHVDFSQSVAKFKWEKKQDKSKNDKKPPSELNAPAKRPRETSPHEKRRRERSPVDRRRHERSPSDRKRRDKNYDRRRHDTSPADRRRHERSPDDRRRRRRTRSRSRSRSRPRHRSPHDRRRHDRSPVDKRRHERNYSDRRRR